MQMDSHELETTGIMKRKRSPMQYPIDENAGRQGLSNVTMINYMTKERSEKLRLMEGDSETFSDILGLIDDYEGVLQRHESLAANLGAKLVAPLLLKSFLKLFEGPIKIIQDSPALSESPATWLDIVTFARTNPTDFILIENENVPGELVSRIWIRGGQIEISENDFRLIMSGGPECIIPTQPVADDESAEICTLSILEARLAVLIKKADAVASKARRLNYQIKCRQSAILSRKAAVESNTSGGTDTPCIPRTFSAIASHNFAQNQTLNRETAQIQTMLLEQYLSHSQRVSNNQLRKPKASKAEPDARTYLPQEPRRNLKEVTNRLVMTSRIEKLNRGDLIRPACDRCRRLKFECVKYLTACQACTKKHAKCSWKDAEDCEFDLSPGSIDSTEAKSSCMSIASNSRDSSRSVNIGSIRVEDK